MTEKAPARVVLGHARRSSRSRFPHGLLKRLARSGFKVVRLSYPDYWVTWRAMDLTTIRVQCLGVDEFLWVIRKTRQRACKCAKAPTDRDARAGARQERGGEGNPRGGENQNL